MADYLRYGIYYLPESPLADFGARWLGWDVQAGVTVEQPELSALGPRLERITRRPRKYGFHATIKAPFRLAQGEGQGAEALEDALRALARVQRRVTLDRVKPAVLGRFLALVPEGRTDALDALAAAVVRELDPFRAPPTEAELAKRRAQGLTPAQEANLARWGYPKVMEDFRFHMTLTAPLQPEELPAVEQALADLGPPLPEPFVIDSLSLVGEGGDGMFREIARCPLGDG